MDDLTRARHLAARVRDEAAVRARNGSGDWYMAFTFADADLIIRALSNYLPVGAFGLQASVEKVGGAEWSGRVVGFYSTALTPIGYAIESLVHKGSVQIYPEKALRLVQRARPLA